MATVKFKGTPIRLSGDLPAVGQVAPPFLLAAADLSEKGLDAFTGKLKILSIVPSLDTSVCATSARRFNETVVRIPGAVVINISADLPFAQKRFCDADGLAHIVTLSTFRAPTFGSDYGVRIEEGLLAGLMARAVLVLDQDNRVVYSELVPEVAQEPDYDSALAAVARVAG